MLILKKMLMTLIILCIPPSGAYWLKWQWQPDVLNGYVNWLFWVTEMAGNPWSIVTAMLFCLLFCFILKIKSYATFSRLIFLLGVAIVVGQGIKTIVKYYSQQPRPYVGWMARTEHIKENEFYSMSEEKRQALVYSIVNKNKKIPAWLSTYWQNEDNYSFPSGHTIFAVTWALLAIIFIEFYHHRLLISFIIGWALLVEISRLLLGMHQPRDIFAGVLIAYVISLGVYFCSKRWHIIRDMD